MATLALRMRVSMSALGSVMVMAGSPTRLGQAGELARVGQLPQAEAAQLGLRGQRRRATTPLAAGVGPDLELGSPVGLLDECLLGHLAGFLASEGAAEIGRDTS